MKFITLINQKNDAVTIIPWHSVSDIAQNNRNALVEIYANDSLYYVDANINDVLIIFAIGGTLNVYEPDECNI